MEFLVRLEDKPDKPGKGAVSKKGDFITYKPDGWTWGRNERLHYGIVRIDCTEKEAAKMCESETEMVYDEKLKIETPVVTQYRKTKFDVDNVAPKVLAVWNDKNADSSIVVAEKI